jgi:hypothetical protein
MNKAYVRSLNNSQYKLLTTIYSFRFSTRSLLSEYCGVPNNTSFYSRLQILQKHEYIATHYDKAYRLAGREAEFYLLPKGLRALHDAGFLEVSDTMQKALYKDKTVGRDFIGHQVQLMRIRNKLVSTHEDLQIFTVRDIQALDYFPKPRPDLFLSVKKGENVIRCFLEYVPAGTVNSKLRKRLEYLTRYYEEDDWSDTDTPFPAVLFVAETKLAEVSLRKLIARERYHSGTDVTYYTATQKSIFEMSADNSAVWIEAADANNLSSLVDIT